MEKAAKEVAPEITPAEEIKVSTEEIVAEAVLMAIMMAAMADPVFA